MKLKVKMISSLMLLTLCGGVLANEALASDPKGVIKTIVPETLDDLYPNSDDEDPGDAEEQDEHPAKRCVSPGDSDEESDDEGESGAATKGETREIETVVPTSLDDLCGDSDSDHSFDRFFGELETFRKKLKDEEHYVGVEPGEISEIGQLYLPYSKYLAAHANCYAKGEEVLRTDSHLDRASCHKMLGCPDRVKQFDEYAKGFVQKHNGGVCAIPGYRNRGLEMVVRAELVRQFPDTSGLLNYKQGAITELSKLGVPKDLQHELKHSLEEKNWVGIRANFMAIISAPQTTMDFKKTLGGQILGYAINEYEYNDAEGAMDVIKFIIENDYYDQDVKKSIEHNEIVGRGYGYKPNLRAYLHEHGFGWQFKGVCFERLVSGLGNLSYFGSLDPTTDDEEDGETRGSDDGETKDSCGALLSKK